MYEPTGNISVIVGCNLTWLIFYHCHLRCFDVIKNTAEVMQSIRAIFLNCLRSPYFTERSAPAENNRSDDSFLMIYFLQRNINYSLQRHAKGLISFESRQTERKINIETISQVRTIAEEIKIYRPVSAWLFSFTLSFFSSVLVTKNVWKLSPAWKSIISL